MSRIYCILALMVTAALFVGGACAQIAPFDHGPKNALSLLSQPNHHAILRHALAPGNGDPEDFTLGDCTTQRNLDAIGREQSRALGAAFKATGITADHIWASPWCRTMETAQLMDIGPVLARGEVSSVWTQPYAKAQSQTEELIELLTSLPDNETAVMVTHSVNIGALTGSMAISGHGYVIKVEGGEASIVASFGPPQD